MKKQDELQSFYELTRITFTLHAKQADEIYFDLGFEKEDEAYNVWFESFVEVTNILMKNTQTSDVSEHFMFFLSYLDDASDLIRKCIDVSYVENLFWGVDQDSIKTYWALLPERMQVLYKNFHASSPIK